MNLNKLYKILYKYVATGKETSLASQMRGVYHDHGNLVACNTGTLFVINCGLVYAPVNEGRILHKNGEFVETLDGYGKALPYPDYKKIIPEKFADANLILCGNECKELVNACKLIPKLKDGAKQVYIRIGNLATVDPKIVVDVAEAFNVLGEEFDVFVFTSEDKQYKPVVFASRCSTSAVVVMPFYNVECCISILEALEIGDLL